MALQPVKCKMMLTLSVCAKTTCGFDARYDLRLWRTLHFFFI